MRSDYQKWLEEQKYSPGTVTAQLRRVERVEKYYGGLEEHFRQETLQAIIEELQYSTEDERRARPNPSKIPFEGNVRNNLQSYKNAVVRYHKFITGWERSNTEEFDIRAEVMPSAPITADQEAPSQKLSLERDMQAALRANIHQLGATLSVIDDGAERHVHSGFIDVTCEDSKDNALVVIELKAGKADSRAIGQILGYMGNLAEEEPDRNVRGILVAHDFDKRSKSAARVVPTLCLVRYAVNFCFDEEQ